ncbi:MAG: hypothetical protein SGPRY_009695 [Prymnesium sp.]
MAYLQEQIREALLTIKHINKEGMLEDVGTKRLLPAAFHRIRAFLVRPLEEGERPANGEGLAAENKYQGVKKPATDGVTTAELRNARSDIRFARFGDMSEEMPTFEKLDLEDQQKRMQQAAREFDAGSEPLPVLRGVMMTSEHDFF